MGEYQCRCIEFQSSSDDNPGVNASAVHGPPEKPLESYQAVLTVKEQKYSSFSTAMWS